MFKLSPVGAEQADYWNQVTPTPTPTPTLTLTLALTLTRALSRSSATTTGSGSTTSSRKAARDPAGRALGPSLTFTPCTVCPSASCARSQSYAVRTIEKACVIEGDINKFGNEKRDEFVERITPRDTRAYHPSFHATRARLG